jgi:hypothetical protein
VHMTRTRLRAVQRRGKVSSYSPSRPPKLPLQVNTALSHVNNSEAVSARCRFYANGGVRASLGNTMPSRPSSPCRRPHRSFAAWYGTSPMWTFPLGFAFRGTHSKSCGCVLAGQYRAAAHADANAIGGHLHCIKRRRRRGVGLLSSFICRSISER